MESFGLGIYFINFKVKLRIFAVLQSTFFTIIQRKYDIYFLNDPTTVFNFNRFEFWRNFNDHGIESRGSSLIMDKIL